MPAALASRARGGLWLCLVFAVGCASGPDPRPEDIWHESSLKPRHVAPETAGERELLARLSDVPTGQAVTLGGQVFLADAPYTAASGRICRAITILPAGGDGPSRVKLACDHSQQGWVFVPDPFGGDTGARVASGGAP